MLLYLYYEYAMCLLYYTLIINVFLQFSQLLFLILHAYDLISTKKWLNFNSIF